MKRSFVFMLISIFILVSFIIVGCGGKSKKISEVSQEEEEVLEEAAEAKKEELPTTYVVKEGDKLWTIAEKPEIYGNKWQWPLIYDANRDILESYNNLEPGQTLIIPRNVSAVEIEAAKERAMELGIPPKEKEEEEEVEESVVGLGEGTKSEESTEASSKEEEYMGEETSEGMEEGTGEEEGMLEEEPTPIPEPTKPKKKGGINLLLIIILILLIVGGVVIYIFIKQKKEEEEEDIISKKDDDEDAGILT